MATAAPPRTQRRPADDDAGGPGEARADSGSDAPVSAEQICLAFADAWGQMGSAWGVQPSVARVHGYLLARDELLTEREVREALGLSHRAASLALAETEAWGLIERVPDPRRAGRRGPSATAFKVTGDRWRWLQEVAERRKEREADPLRPLVAACHALAERAAAEQPSDPDVARLRDWLTDLMGFMGLFDRAVMLLARADTAQVASGFNVLAGLSDAALHRLLVLFGTLPEKDLAATLDAVSRVSPTTARRILSAARKIASLSRSGSSSRD